MSKKTNTTVPKEKRPLEKGDRVRLRGYSSSGRLAEGLKGVVWDVLCTGDISVALDNPRAGTRMLVVTASQCRRLKPPAAKLEQREARRVWLLENQVPLPHRGVDTHVTSYETLAKRIPFIELLPHHALVSADALAQAFAEASRIQQKQKCSFHRAVAIALGLSAEVSK